MKLIPAEIGLETVKTEPDGFQVPWFPWRDGKVRRLRSIMLMGDVPRRAANPHADAFEEFGWSPTDRVRRRQEDAGAGQ